MEYILGGFISFILAIIKITVWTSLGWFWVFLPTMLVAGVFIYSETIDF